MSSLKEWSVAFPRGACSLSHMDKVLWKSEVIPLKGRGLLNIPEIALPTLQTFPFQDTTQEDSPVLEQEAISPTLSIDSGRSTGTSLWPSSKYFVHGGPGFSIGVLDSTTGTIDHLPIPFPTTTQVELLNSDNFCTSEVTCTTLVGETQLWAGTESGSLHVFELSPGPRLSKHSYCKLPDCVCCLKTDTLITSRYFSLNGRRSNQGRLNVSKAEVMVGSSNGTLTIMSGEANDRGSLLNIGKCPRKVVHLGDGRGCCRVQCIALVSSMGTEHCWCGCGSRIIILQRGNWKVLARLDAMVGFPLDESDDNEEQSWMDLQVRHLEPTEDGVWSSMEHSPAVVLWDTKYFSPKLKISCFQSRPETPIVNHQAQVTALAQLEDVICVGTQGGYLLLFHIHHRATHMRTRNSISLNGTQPAALSLPSSPKMSSRHRRLSGSDLDYTLMGASHCSCQPVISIYPYGTTHPAHSPISTPSCSPLNILVLTGCGTASLNSSHQSSVHLYEVTGGSPLESPLCSPQGGIKGGGRGSSMSSKSLPSGSLIRKCSLNNLEDLPELTLHTVSKNSVSYLPLQKSS